ncbi:MAG: hypothetical protein V1816_24790 [Pseudomonadota bacterium]
MKKRIGVLPVDDIAGVGTEGLEAELGDLIAGSLAQYESVIVTPWSELEKEVEKLGLKLPLEENDVLKIGQARHLNALILGAITEATQQRKRTQIGNMAPFLLGKKNMTTVVMIGRVVDAHTGITLSAGTGKGEAEALEESQSQIVDSRGHSLDQAALAASCDSAIKALSEKIIATLAASFWDGYILEVRRNQAVMLGGRDLGVLVGDGFKVFSEGENITNVVGQTFKISGPPRAALTAVEVNADTTILQIESGEVKPGDMVRHVSSPED